MDGARLALIVANDAYDDSELGRLEAPAHDAEALAAVLRDPGVGSFDVQVRHNETAQAIRVAVEEFFADRSPEDLLLLHFSCHGVKNADGELFLALRDTRPKVLASTGLAADFVNRQMAASRAQRIALFLDCCYGGAFPRGMLVRASAEAQVKDAFTDQADLGGGRGRVVVTASNAMQYSFEGGQLGEHKETPSVFTGALIDALTTGEADRDGDGWIGMNELFAYLEAKVPSVSPNQTPQMWAFGATGDIRVARSRVRRITAAPLAPELSEAMESPLPAARFGVVDSLRERRRTRTSRRRTPRGRHCTGSSTTTAARSPKRRPKQSPEASRRVAPVELDLELADGVAVGELQVEGPPIARIAVASSEVRWVRVEQEGATVRVTAAPTAPTDRLASVIVEGPTGQCTVPVGLTMPDTESEPPPPPPEPEPPSQPTPVPQPPTPEQAQPTPTVGQSPQPSPGRNPSRPPHPGRPRNLRACCDRWQSPAAGRRPPGLRRARFPGG